MSTYPGDDPQSSGDKSDDSPAGDPTQPLGYWERQAAERAGEQQAPVAPAGPPTADSSGSGTTNPYGDIPGANPYGPYAPAAPTHPTDAYPPGAPPATGNAWPPPPPTYGYSPTLPDHPQSTLALVLGLVGLVGAFVFCGLPLLVSPFAWALGRNALTEIRASQGRLGGESQARAGMIMGIIGTVVLVLAVLAIIGFVALITISETSAPGSSI